MGSSRNVSFFDKTWLSGRIVKVLSSVWYVHLVSDQIGLVWIWGSMSLFPDSMHEAGVVAVWVVFDDGFDPVVVACVLPSALLLNVVTLPMKTLSWRRVTWRGAWGYSPRSLLKNHLICLSSKFIFRVKRFGVISSMCCRLRSAT